MRVERPMTGFQKSAATVVFIQAPADVAYAITICEAARGSGSAVVLIVVNVRSVYEYLVEAQLPDIVVHFVPYLLQPMPRWPWSLWGARLALARHFAAALADRNIAEAWFFCVDWDAVTPYFLKRLPFNTQIFLADHYGMTEPREKRWTWKLAVKWFYLRIVTGIDFGFCRETLETGNGKVWRTTFDPRVLKAQRVQIAPSFSRFPLPGRIQLPFVILMDANDESSSDISGYAEVVAALITELRSRKVDIVLKAHPRTGCSAFLNAFRLPALPAGCPLELFDTSGASAVIGINSLGLAAIAKLGQTAISLLDLITFRDEEPRRFWRKWMARHSDQKVLFPRSQSEALDMVTKNRPKVV
jgi:hypothetical protein